MIGRLEDRCGYLQEFCSHISFCMFLWCCHRPDIAILELCFKHVQSIFVFVSVFFLIFTERKKGPHKRILNIFTLSQKTHRIPSILVDGPKASGKSTFIRTASSLLCSESSAKYSECTKNLNQQAA